MARRPRLSERVPERAIWLVLDRVADFYKLGDFVKTLAARHIDKPFRVYLSAYLTAQPGDLPANVRLLPLPPEGRRKLPESIEASPPWLILFGTDVIEPAVIPKLRSYQVPTIKLVSRSPGWLWRARKSGKEYEGTDIRFLCASDTLRSQLVRAGISELQVENIGPIGGTPHPAPVDEHLLTKFRDLLVRRPIWHASNILSKELPMLAEVQRVVRISHPNALCIVTSRDALEPQQLMQSYPGMRIRSVHSTPEARTEMFYADNREEWALWHRLASVTFLGGSMFAEPMSDPVGPAALGSALLHGPHVHPFSEICGRFSALDAAVRVETSSAMIDAVQRLLLPDEAAKMAVAAWEVLSQASIATERLVALSDEMILSSGKAA